MRLGALTSGVSLDSSVSNNRPRIYREIPIDRVAHIEIKIRSGRTAPSSRPVCHLYTREEDLVRKRRIYHHREVKLNPKKLR